MSHTVVDHLVVAAASLEQGVAWCRATLGVEPGPGGKHALMGTHNRLLKIATDVHPDAYLEIIAIDPQAPPPGRARWFGLDGAALQASLSAAPRLVHLVARSTMLDMHRWGLMTVGCTPGDPVKASRDTPQGLLSWEMLLRADGQLGCGGALPTLIQWHGMHPATQMPPSGVTLQSLVLAGVPQRARDVLRLRGVRWVDAVEPAEAAEAAEAVGTAANAADGPPAIPAIIATLHTPLGAVVLRSASQPKSDTAP